MTSEHLSSDETRHIVSVHIPKTGGTSLGSVFDVVFNRRVFYDYDGYTSPTKCSDIVKQNAKFISEYFAVTHGHYYAQKYLTVYPESAYISVVRHPVDRIISQFVHELADNTATAWYHADIKSGRMGVVDFAQQPGIGNAMHLHLQARPLSKYDLLLVTEQLWKSVHVLSRKVRKFPIEAHFGGTLPRINESKIQRSAMSFDEKTRIAIYEKSQADNEIYMEAVSLLARHSADYL